MKFKHLASIALICSLSTFAFSAEPQETSTEDLKKKVMNIQEQLDDLVVQGGKYAYLQIAQKNGLSPFAVGVDKIGSVIMLEVPKSEEKATFKDKILKLREMLKLGADKGKFEAAALFVQAQVPFKGEKVDGVAIEMEHKKGLSVLRFSPYEVDRGNKKIQFKQPVDKIKPVVFFKDVKSDANS